MRTFDVSNDSQINAAERKREKKAKNKITIKKFMVKTFGKSSHMFASICLQIVV